MTSPKRNFYLQHPSRQHHQHTLYLMVCWSLLAVKDMKTGRQKIYENSPKEKITNLAENVFLLKSLKSQEILAFWLFLVKNLFIAFFRQRRTI